METPSIYMFSSGFSIGGQGMAHFIVFHLMDTLPIAFYAAEAIRVRLECSAGGVFWNGSLGGVVAVFFAWTMRRKGKSLEKMTRSWIKKQEIT